MLSKLLQEPLDAVSILIPFLVAQKRFIRLKHIKIFETVQKSNDKIVSKEAPEYGY